VITRQPRWHLNTTLVSHAGGFTPDGRTVVTAGGERDGSIRSWNPKAGECTATIPAGYGGHSDAGATCLAFSADSTLVATGGVDGSVVLSNVSTGKAVAQLLGHRDSVEGVAFAHGLQLVISGSIDGNVIIWETTVGSRRGTCAHPAGVTAVAMQHRGPLFATACLDGVVRVFDVRSAQAVATFGGHTAPVQAVAWAPDDAHVASGSDDHTVRVFQCVA
jgi:angio-associated migratory cell protein